MVRGGRVSGNEGVFSDVRRKGEGRGGSMDMTDTVT